MCSDDYPLPVQMAWPGRPICKSKGCNRPVVRGGTRKNGSVRYKPICGSCDWSARQKRKDDQVLEEVTSGIKSLTKKHQQEVTNLTIRLSESEQDLAGVRADLGRRLEESQARARTALGGLAQLESTWRARHQGVTADLKKKLEDATSVAASSIEKSNQSSRRAIRESNRAKELEHTVVAKLEEIRSHLNQVGVLTKERDALQSEVEQRRVRELDLTASLESEKRRLAERDRRSSANYVSAESSADLLKVRTMQLQDVRFRLEYTDRKLTEAEMEIERVVALKQGVELELCLAQKSCALFTRLFWVSLALSVFLNLGWLALWRLA